MVHYMGGRRLNVLSCAVHGHRPPCLFAINSKPVILLRLYTVGLRCSESARRLCCDVYNGKQSTAALFDIHIACVQSQYTVHNSL